MFFIKTSCGVTEDFKSKVVNDVQNPLAWDWRFCRSSQRKIKQAKELAQRSLHRSNRLNIS